MLAAIYFIIVDWEWYSLLTFSLFSSTQDPVSAIYAIIRGMAEGAPGAIIQYDDVVPRVFAKGYTQQQLDQCLNEYERINVWQINQNRTQIRFADY